MLIGTDRFRPVLEATHRLSGIEHLTWAEVAHPLGSLTTELLAERAREAVDQFERIVLDGR